MRAKKWPKALAAAEAAVKKFPAELQAFEMLDYVLCGPGSGDADEDDVLRRRVGAYDAMIALNPDDRRDVYLQADYVWGLHSQRFGVLATLAWHGQDLGALQRAYLAIERAIELHPENALHLLRKKADAMAFVLGRVHEPANAAAVVKAELVATCERGLALARQRTGSEWFLRSFTETIALKG